MMYCSLYVIGDLFLTEEVNKRSQNKRLIDTITGSGKSGDNNLDSKYAK